MKISSHMVLWYLCHVPLETKGQIPLKKTWLHTHTNYTHIFDTPMVYVKKGSWTILETKMSIHRVRTEDWRSPWTHNYFSVITSCLVETRVGRVTGKEDRKNWWFGILKIVSGLANSSLIRQVPILLCNRPIFLLDCHMCVSVSLRACGVLP